MYYITTKHNVTPFALLGKNENRQAARSMAKDLGGTVKDEIAYRTARVDAGLSADDAVVLTVKLVIEPAEKKSEAKPGDWIGYAEEIRETKKLTCTVGKEAKVLKRVITPDSVLTEARKLLAMHPTSNKVETVRSMARWVSSDGFKLQRRDIIALLAVSNPEIATYTVTTQFQLVRSGKLK